MVTACNAQPEKERIKIPSHLEALPAESYAYGDDGEMQFRVITLANEFYGYRKPDYKGGFYLWMQKAWATKKEIANQTPFDSLQNIPQNYLLHYIPQNGGKSTNDWSIPEFYIFYKKLTPPFDIDTIHLADTAGWESYIEAEARGQVPDPMLPYTRLNMFYFDKKNSNIQTDYKPYLSLHIYEQEEALTVEEIFETIKDLKNREVYDTLITRNQYMIYINTDLACYEQPAQPDAFYITHMQLYPDGKLKERYHFLPGVYTSYTIKSGYSERYDEDGEPQFHFHDLDYFPNPLYGAGLPYLFELLKQEGWIDPENGIGKPVMTMNKDVDPHADFHGVERLSIRSMWNIQVDHTTTGSVGLLVQHEDDMQTVYIIDKLSGNILDKFKRRG